MKYIYHSVYTYALLFLVLLINASCGFANIKADGANQSAVENNGDGAATAQSANLEDTPQITAQSVVGTYEYDTYNNGEGYDNSLEITNAGGGKLNVFLSGSYIYKVGETQSFHEAEGKGEATLRGNTANTILVDEAGKPCRATIIFNKTEANVKIPEACRFNIELNGVYKKAKAQPAEKQAKTAPKEREISFDALYDFVNDFDNYKPGERFVITNVPANQIGKNSRADEFGNQSYKNLFYLQPTGDEETVANGFLTSKEMVKSLETNAEIEPSTLRITAVLVESTGKFDVYRTSFVTKVEGLDEDGKAIWTAIGTEPAKVKFTH